MCRCRIYAAFVLSLVCVAVLVRGNATALEQIDLSKAQETRVERFLFPLPQELHLRGIAYPVPLQGCALQAAASPTALEKQMVDDFRGRWEKRCGTALQTRNGELTITAGLMKSVPALQQAAARDIFDAKYLRERPNPEQAYILVTESDGKHVTLYAAANEPQGLYYALLTVDQLLQSLSTKEAVVLPHVRIVDWPDVRLRGSWTVFKRDQTHEDTLRQFSQWKYNMAEAWYLLADKTAADGTLQVTWSLPKEVIEIGKRYAVTVYPGSGHVAHGMGSPLMKKLFPGAAAKHDREERRPLGFCRSSPDTPKFFDQYLASIARQFDLAEIWMSELEGERGVCHCPKCKGLLGAAFVKEAEFLMAAYRKAKKINPKFTMILGLTQGSYPHHAAMLKHIPKDVILNFYNGIMTYRTTFQTYNLPPSVQEMRRLGYTVGGTPSPAETQMKFPFSAPQYCRLLCSEIKDRDLDFMLSEFWPSVISREFNGPACAEFLWNSSGRTAREFAAAWATRKELKDPEETADVICMVEYPARGLHNCGLGQIVSAVVQYMTGKDRASANVYSGFEHATHAEMARIRAVCEEATTRARRLENPGLTAGCEVLAHWTTILERYAFCVEHPKDKAGVQAAMEAIKSELRSLPKSRNAWMASKTLSPYAQRCTGRWFAALEKQWQPALTAAPGALSPEVKRLLEARETGALMLLPLNTTWRFKTVAKGGGLAGQWFSPKIKDTTWTAVRTDKDCGYEKQGFEGYTGYAWYRQTLQVPKDAAGRKHLFLLFQAVDEDAEVWVNGEKAFTHSHETVGGLPGSTWNKPFAVDAKEWLKPDAENLVAVRVYNRKGMGGIWKPVTLIATDAVLAPKTLVELVTASQP